LTGQAMSSTSAPQYGAAFISVFLTLVLLICVLAACGPHEALAPICTEFMYARGWTCFGLWISLAIVARPNMPSGGPRLRPMLHGAAWAVAWLWWVIAVSFADLHSRADLLFDAYLITGCFIILWRVRLHQVVLSSIVRGAFARSSYTPGVIIFLGASPSDTQAHPASTADRMLAAIGRIRTHPWIDASYRVLFGARGASALIMRRAMDNTDLRCIRMRSALEASDIKASAERTRQEATDLGRAFRCEAEIWLTMHQDSLEQPLGAAIQARALCVYALLSLAMVRRVISRSPDMEAALALLATNQSFPTLALRMLREADCAQLRDIERIMIECEQLEGLDAPAYTLGRIAVTAALCRHRLFKQARGVLANSKREFFGPVEDPLLERIHKALDALRAEVEFSSYATAGPSRQGQSRSDTDRRVLLERARRADAAVSSGEHPRSGVVVIPSQFARLPRPRRVCEIGVGLIGGALAIAALLLILPLPYFYPLSSRLQTVTDVPFCDGIASEGIRSATVTSPHGSPTILLADPTSGVRKMDLRTMRAGVEGGPGTELDGAVVKLASKNNDAASTDDRAFAVFRSVATRDSAASLCVSERDRSGKWTLRIGPAKVDLDGQDLEAALHGLAKPLFLRRSGDNRLLRYDESKRCLDEAVVEGQYSIQGRFIDSAESITPAGSRSIALLTTLADGSQQRLYSITERQASRAERETDALEIKALSLPPLEKRTAVAICIASTGSIITLDSGGGAWRTSIPSASQDGGWERLRAGCQDLALDKIDLALVTEDGKRLWFIRNGRVWTRSLESAANDSSISSGWSSTMLPERTLATSSHKDRWQFLESADEERGVYLLAPAGDPEQKGAVLGLTVQRAPQLVDGSDAESISTNEPLAQHETLLDADTHVGYGLLSILERPEDDPRHRFLRLALLKSGIRTIRRSPLTTEAFSLDGLLGVDGLSGTIVALDSTGHFISFDASSDQLRTSGAGAEKFVGSINLLQNPPSIDAAISVGQTASTAFVLEPTGSVAEYQLTPGANRTELVNSTQEPPSDLLAARFIFTSERGATFFAADQSWTFDAANAKEHFLDQSVKMGSSPTDFILAMPSGTGGEPTLAWLSDDGQRLGSFSGGEFKSLELDMPLQRLLAGDESSLFALNRGNRLVSLDFEAQPTELLQPQSGGPAGRIEYSGIREGFVDFVTSDALHSIRRQDAIWTKMALATSYRLESVDEARAVLLPREQGVAYFLDRNSAADQGTWLGKRGELRNARVFGDGVIGMTPTEPAWVRFDNTAATLAPRARKDLDLLRVTEALEHEGDLILLGNEHETEQNATADRILRYSLQSTAESWNPPNGDKILALRRAENELYALTDNSLFRLNASTLKQIADYRNQLPPGRRILGERDDRAGAPALLSAGAIHSIEQNNLIELLLAPDAVLNDDPNIVWATASGDEITLFTDRGTWKRRSSPTTPFREVEHIRDAVELAILSRRGETWARTSLGWRSVSPVSTEGNGIGWSAAGERISDHDGQPRLDGVPIRGFDTRAADNTVIGELRGFEQFNPDLLLLVGESGNLFFDPNTREFPETPQSLHGWNIVDFATSDLGMIARNDQGIAAKIVPAGASPLFGQQPVRQLLTEVGPLAITSQSRIADAEGNPVGNCPPVKPGPSLHVVDAVSIGSLLYRADAEGRIDCIDTGTMESSQVEAELRADWLMRAGETLLAFDESSSTMFMPKQATKRWRVDGDKWFVGRNSVAFASGDMTESLTVIADGPAPSRPARERLSGKVRGNLANSTTAAIEIDGRSIMLFDLLKGSTVLGRTFGPDSFIDGDALLSVADATVSRTGPLGETLQSRRFASATAIPTEVGARAFGLEVLQAEIRLLEVEPSALNDQEIRRFTPKFPRIVSTPEHPVRVIGLDESSRLLISSQELALDDGKTVTTVPNPLQSSDFKLWSFSNRYFVDGPEGSRIEILSKDGAGLRLVSPPGIPERLKGRWDWHHYRFARKLVLSTVAGLQVPLSSGTLDTETGWILEEQPAKLIRALRGIELAFKDGRAELIPGTEPKSIEPLLVAPLSEQDGVIYVIADGRKIELGPPNLGRRFKAHMTRAVAPIETAPAQGNRAIGLAWIDDAGQLWAHRGDRSRCVDSVGDLDCFKIDEDGELFAVGDERVILVSAHGEHVVARDRAKLIQNRRQLPGQLGWIRWSRGAREGRFLEWELALPDGREPLQACVGGFDLLAGAQLGMNARSACLVLRSEPALSVPIVERDERWQVDWTAPPSRAPITAPRAPRAPRTEIRLDDGNSALLFDEEGALFLLKGEPFRFLPDLARFECNICKSASSIDGRLVTLLENNKLASWTLAERRASYPQFIPDPPEPPTPLLWESIEGELCIRTASFADQPSYWRWKNGVWQAEVPNRFVAAPGALWSWLPDTRRLSFRNVDYEFAAGLWPWLEFEQLDQSAAPRTTAARGVLFRSDDKQWYLLPGTLPVQSEAPPSLPETNIVLGQLQIKGSFPPECTLGGRPVTLSVKDGLIPDLDYWRPNDPIVPLSPDAALVPVGKSAYYRRILLRNGQLTLLAPELVLNPVSIECRRNLEQQGLSLGPDHELRVNGASLGIPDADGFPQFDAKTVVPIHHEPRGALKVVAKGRIYSLSTNTGMNLLDSIAEEGDALDVVRSAWIMGAGKCPIFVLARRDGVLLVDGPNGLERVPPQSDAGAPMLVHDAMKANSFIAQLQSESIRLTKPEYDITLRRRADGKIALEHQQAGRVIASEGGFTSYSDKWAASYVVQDDSCVLRSVKPVTEPERALLLAPRVLGGNLFAHRLQGAGGWRIGISPERPDSAWPFSALSEPPSRVYAAESECSLEFGRNWRRITDSRGIVIDRLSLEAPHPLGEIESRRRGKHVLTRAGIFSATSLEPLVETAPLPEPGSVPARQIGRWKLSLERSGAALAISYGELDLTVSDGALALDFAVALGAGPSEAWLADRLSVVSLAGNASPRSLHGAATRGVLAAHQPVRMAFLNSESKPTRTIVTRQGEPSSAILLANASGMALEPTAAGPLLNTWTRGESLDVRLDDAGKVEFRRRDSANRWQRYPPISLNDACVDGRFPFDTPQDLIIARHPKRPIEEACIVTQMGWEWLEQKRDGGVEFVLDPPVEIPPRYGPTLNADWLSDTDLDAESATPRVTDSGKPIIWFPHDDRLFFVGERNFMWIELGSRWRGRPVNPRKADSASHE
jgi:hypothetical protein